MNENDYISLNGELYYYFGLYHPGFGMAYSLNPSENTYHSYDLRILFRAPGVSYTAPDSIISFGSAKLNLYGITDKEEGYTYRVCLYKL